VTRRTKIRVAASCVALALITWIFWPKKEEENLRIVFAGVDWRSARVKFGVTNSSGAICHFKIGWQQQTNRVWQMTEFGPGLSEIPAHKYHAFEAPNINLARWRPVIEYNELPQATLLSRVRLRLSLYAYNRNRMRLFLWLYPKPKSYQVFGPEMDGNKPAPEARP
jgi:hypothetical protein